MYEMKYYNTWLKEIKYFNFMIKAIAIVQDRSLVITCYSIVRPLEVGA